MTKERIAHFQEKVDGLKVAREELVHINRKGRLRDTEFKARAFQLDNTIEVYENKIAKLVAALPKEVKCSKCGQMAHKSTQVRDEEGILLFVKYHHGMIPESGYEWTCTQVMEYEPIYNTNGSVKKEMDKRPYAFKSRTVNQYSGLHGEKVTI